MKAFFIITRTSEMHKHFESFLALGGNEVKTYVYNHAGQGWPSGHQLDQQIVTNAREYSPDIIVYVGACAGNIPSPDCFRTLRTTIAPTIHFCSDAADKPWWPRLEEYMKTKAFNVQVALDGAPEWPRADNHVTALTPLDPKRFPNPIKPHAERSIYFGFAGNPGNRNRKSSFDRMAAFGLKHRIRKPCTGDTAKSAASYQEAADFMSDTRIMPNYAWTGSYERFHVKGRVVEAGWAGCLLLEHEDSPARNFFKPGEDFLTWKEPQDIRPLLERFKDNPIETEQFGARLRKKVEEHHCPQKFWGRIMERL